MSHYVRAGAVWPAAPAAAAAWVEAVMSAGSALGGLGYGAVPWRSPPGGGSPCWSRA